MTRLLMIGAGFLAMTAGAEAAKYDIRLDEKNGERTLAVSQADADAFAVAAGGEDLRLLSGDEARAAFERLSSHPKTDIKEWTEKSGGKEGGAKKVVIHKMQVDEEDKNGEKSREVRVIRKNLGKEEDLDVFIESFDGDLEDLEKFADEDFVLKGAKAPAAPDAPDAPAAPVAPDVKTEKHRVIRMIGVDAKAATRFIDRTEGLDRDEKAAIKSAVGL